MRHIPLYLKNKLSKLGIKTRTVTAFDDIYEVPRHITKLPYGWQVRFDRKSEQYFSCSFANNNYGGADNALDEAILCLLEEQEKHMLTDYLTLSSKDEVKISFAKSSRQANGIPCYKASVTLLNLRSGELAIANRYLGTANTLTQERLDDVVKELTGAWYWAKTMKEEIGRTEFSKIAKDVPDDVVNLLPDNFKIPTYHVSDLIN